MLQKITRPFTSLRLTVTLLALGGILVFWGTLAQVNLGTYQAQNEFFRSFFVYWHPGSGTTRIPIFPGGYTIGSLLLINLFCAHLRYYKVGWKKLGIALIHLGVVLMLLGQLATDMLSQESVLHLRVGEMRNYSEADRRYELAVIEDSPEAVNKVVAIPQYFLEKHNDVTNPEMPFIVRPKAFYENSALSETNAPGLAPVNSTDGTGSGLFWAELPRETDMNRRDLPSAVVELATSKASLGTWLISSMLERPQVVVVNGKNYSLTLRPERVYRPITIKLVEFKHDIYPGTDIPKNFSSRVRVMRPDTGENREVLIYMNNPLRYMGETFYQQSFDADDHGSVLMVVRNPSWTTPYIACGLVFLGLVYQFLWSLVTFNRRRKA